MLCESIHPAGNEEAMEMESPSVVATCGERGGGRVGVAMKGQTGDPNGDGNVLYLDLVSVPPGTEVLQGVSTGGNEVKVPTWDLCVLLITARESAVV